MIQSASLSSRSSWVSLMAQYAGCLSWLRGVLQHVQYVVSLALEYEVRQFNSQNAPVKAKFAYLCTSGCCHIGNTLLVKLCTSWDDGATAGNSLENRFLEYLAVTFSRCIGCQKGQQIFVLSGHFLILERAKDRRGPSQVNKVDGQFL